MSERVRLEGLTMVLPSGWSDVTHDQEQGSPLTLCKEDGVGAIQFSVARYRSGSPPNISVQALREMLEEFGATRGLGVPRDTSEGQGYGRNNFVAGDYASPEERIIVWYVSNGSDVALVTYVTLDPDDPKVSGELGDASAVIVTLDFE